MTSHEPHSRATRDVFPTSPVSVEKDDLLHGVASVTATEETAKACVAPSQPKPETLHDTRHRPDLSQSRLQPNGFNTLNMLEETEDLEKHQER